MKFDWSAFFRYRKAKLTYERQDRRLHVCAEAQYSPFAFAASAAIITAVLIYVVFHVRSLSAQNAVWCAIVTGTCGWHLYNITNPDIATLEVTSLSLRFSSRHSTGEILRASVGQLNFSYGGDDNSMQGLYSAEDLLLPYVTKQQALEVKDDIYAMFPDTPSGTSKPSDLITLDLNR